MFFNGKHIGGLELGPVLRNFLGDPNLCATYEAKARLLLGELKRKMQLGGIKDGITRKTLEDQVKLYARSNQYGLADIDEIGVDVTALAVASTDSIPKCIGYIVQDFIDDSIAQDYYEVSLTTPSGKTLTKYNGEVIAENNGNDFPGFIHNNAFYVDLYSYVNGDYDPNVKFQQVCVQTRVYTHTVTGLGPITWSTEAVTEFRPTLNPGWTYVTSYTYSSGTCGVDADYGTDVTWEEETIPCSCTLLGAVNYLAIGAVPYTKDFGYTYEGLASHYGGGHSQVVAPFFPDQCARDAGSEYNYPGGVTTGQMNFDNWNANRDNFVATANAASEEGYNLSFANYAPFQESTKTYFEFDFYNTRIQAINKRVDNNGFISYSGFYIDGSNIVFTDTRQGNGEFGLFMIPSSTGDQYGYEDSVLSKYAARANSSDTQYTDVGLSGVVVDDCRIYHSYNMTANSRANVISTDKNTYAMQKRFGIPCEVEDGVHNVRVWNNTGHVKVWLLIKDSSGQYYQTTEIPVKTTAGVDLSIKVGEFTLLSELVKAVDL